MNAVLDFTTRLVQVTCGECGILFAMPERFYEAKRADHSSFFCPSGHNRHFIIKSEAEDLREQLAAKESSLRYWREDSERLQGQVRSEQFKTRAERAAKARLKNRVIRGVCPCCSRSFENLRRHMQTKHPEQLAAES